ncbi:MAG TPA: hypothetical protein VJZ94_02400 [Candidatus Paceibacterota bacterium]|nr:hypothetical protein [Candidatus Paceibacterota bacterium]
MKKRKAAKKKPEITVEQLSEAVRRWYEETGGSDRRPLDGLTSLRMITR